MADRAVGTVEADAVRAPSVTFTVEIRVHPDRTEEFERELLGCLANVRNEPTCISANAHRSDGDPGIYLMYEKWEDRDLFFEQVRERPYFRHYRAATAEMLLSEKTLRFWSAIEPIEEEPLR